MLTIPIYNTIVLPQVQYHLSPDMLTKREIERLKTEEHVILLPLKEWKERAELTSEDFQGIGVISEVRGIKKEAEGFILTVEAKERVDITELSINAAEMDAVFRVRQEVADMPREEQEQQLDEMKTMINEAASNYQWGPWVSQFINHWSSAAELISMISPYLNIEAEEKYALLLADSDRERSCQIREILEQFTQSLEVRADVSKKMKESQNNAYREAAIHKQMEILQGELDEMDPNAVSEEDAILEKIKAAGMPEEAEKKLCGSSTALSRKVRTDMNTVRCTIIWIL